MPTSFETPLAVTSRKPIFDGRPPAPDVLRNAIRAEHRAPERDCVVALLAAGRLAPDEALQVTQDAIRLVTALRRSWRRSPVVSLMREYNLSSAEGLRLMCLAEALLRVPDKETAQALIRDKITGGDWRAHLGGASALVNGATRGLDLASQAISARLGSGLARGRDSSIRYILNHAIGRMGEIFVCGETIGAALGKAGRLEKKRFRFSFDMLGEAAVTQQDADRYQSDYIVAIHAIGHAAQGAGVFGGPGISIKLSALHPRYSLHQKARVMQELLPRVAQLFILARKYEIGISIDAEETERLDLSLDLLEALCLDDRLAGWNGIGFVVQA
jgi:RHH-type proline utilization regulon transcriptional repressor/proline dehydrogenase/delta 1-pyrroline-5-carboxylate dehydrogenase